MTEPEGPLFRKITHSFFEKEWREGFDIFYRVRAGKESKYIKFAEYDPDDSTRLDAILKEKQNEVFYVRENDLYKYYRFNILKNLILGLAQDKPPANEVFQRVYPVAVRIFQDYLEIPASDEFLNLLDDIPVLLSEAVEKDNFPFQQLFDLTLKENAIHTHCVNVGLYSLCFARHLGMDYEERVEICRGGMIADIGKKFIPADVLTKTEPLTHYDRAAVRRHPSLGRQTLNNRKRYSDTVLQMTVEHHENFDGSGYPMGLAGQEISWAGRICKIADVFNALTSHRSYRETLARLPALSPMKQKSGVEFDPELLTAFIIYAGKQ